MTPQQARNLKIGIGVVAGLGLLYLIFKKSDNGGSGSDNTGNNGSNVGGGSGVFSVKDATAKLYELMRYSGSDEKKIVNFFRYITPVQFAAINKEFGSRQYNKTLGNHNFGLTLLQSQTQYNNESTAMSRCDSLLMIIS